MSLQQIIDTAVNVEVNRSKLVAQTLSRSGRLSTVSRNWANPFRFTITPKPVWTAEEYRSVFAELLDNDKYLPHAFRLNDVDPTTFRANLGNSWMVNYQGGGDTASGGNNILDSYSATSQTSGAMICLTNTNSTTIGAGTFLVKAGDYLRPVNFRYPYIATTDVIIPTAATGITGVIQPAGTTISTKPNSATNAGYALSFVSTTTRTAITGISSTAGLSVGQIITETGTNVGSFGGLTYIAEIIGATSIVIQSTTACTSGAITFDGTGNTSTPTVCVPIHRGYIGTIGTDATVLVGARAASFIVNVSKLPQIRYLPGQLVELTGNIELIEEIL
jgi:hypothetical protein